MLEYKRKYFTKSLSVFREVKKLLAFEVTKLVNGEEEVINAKNVSAELFSNKGISDNMPTTTIFQEKLNINIVDLLKANIVSSKSKARRLIE